MSCKEEGLPDFYVGPTGTVILAPEGKPGEQSPWPVGLEPDEITTLPVGTKFRMAMSPGQRDEWPGGFGTFDEVPNRSYVRNELAVIREFKPVGELERVVEFEVIQPLPVKSGYVGPQIEVDNHEFRAGGGHQIEMKVPRDERMDYIKPTGKTTYFAEDDPDI